MPITAKTITQRKVLEAELDRIHGEKTGVDNEEFIQGMVAVSVPVHDSHNDVIAAIACHAPTAQASLEQLIKFIPAMRQASTEMAAVFAEQTQQ